MVVAVAIFVDEFNSDSVDLGYSFALAAASLGLYFVGAFLGYMAK